MAVARARNVIPGSGQVFSTPPKLEGDFNAVAGAQTAFARLWNKKGEMVWIRPMTQVGTSGHFYYQIINLTGSVVGEVQTIAFHPSVSGGTFSLGINGISTRPIPWVNTSVMVTNVKAALDDHCDLSPTDTTVAYNTGTKTITINFVGARYRVNMDQTTCNGTLLTGSTAVTVATSGNGDADVAANYQGQYFWDMIGYDTTLGLFSGDATFQRGAFSSGLAEFWIDPGPAVLTPAGTNIPQKNTLSTINTTQVNFQWLVFLPYVPVNWTALQVSNNSTGEIIDIMPGPGVVFATTDKNINSYKIPYNAVKADGTVYKWNLTVRTESGLYVVTTGTFKIVFSRPSAPTATLNFIQNNELLNMTWSKSGEGANFVDYLVRVRETGVDYNDVKKNRVVARITDINQLGTTSYEFPFNKPITVSFVQRAKRDSGTAIVESNPVQWSSNVAYDGIHLSEAGDAPRMAQAYPYHTGRNVAGVTDPTLIRPWGSSKPIALIVSGDSYLIRFTAKIDGSGWPSLPRDVWEQTKAFHENTEKRTLLYRDALGDMYYCVMNKPTLNVAAGGESPTMEVELPEVYWPPIALG